MSRRSRGEHEHERGDRDEVRQHLMLVERRRVLHWKFRYTGSTIAASSAGP